MGILKGDIKLVASQVMADTANGGGAPTTTIIADAVSNALFPDISELDRAVGRNNLRKVFVHVQTPDLDQYFGANVIVAEPPQDPNTSVTIFSTGEVFDRRDAARNRIEAYLNVGPLWQGFLYENHLAGQRVIQLFQRPTAALPTVGRTLVLTWHAGLGDQKQQYVRFTRVEAVEQVFADGTGNYNAMVVTCDLSDPLEEDFPGTAANRLFTAAGTAAVVRDTVVADAGQYFGVVPLEDAVAVGDATAKATSIYTQLVPSARTELSIVDARPSNTVDVVLAQAPRVVTVPSAPNAQRFKVGQENRGFNWVTILQPKPAPGSVRVQYRAGGNTYYLQDDAAGALSGSGVGTVNYITGSVSITLEALPDDRSNVIVYWGQNATYTNRSAELNYRMPEFSYDLAHQGVVPGSLSVTWLSGGVVKTATANAAGVFSGDGTGHVNHAAGLVFLVPNSMIDPGGELETSYQWDNMVEEVLVGLSPDVTGQVTLSFTDVPVAGTVSAEWVTVREASVSSGAVTSRGSTTKSNDKKNSVTFIEQTKRFADDGHEIILAFAEPIPVPVGPVLEPNPPGRVVTTKIPVLTSTETAAGNNSSFTQSSQQTGKTQVTVNNLVTDDGVGHWFGTFGNISYAGKSATLKVIANPVEATWQSDHEESTNWESLNATTDAGVVAVGLPAPATASTGGGGSSTARGGAGGSRAVAEQFGTAGLLLRYRTGAGSPTAHTETWQPRAVNLDLMPLSKDQIVPGSVQFVWMGTRYRDYDGVVVRGDTDLDPGIPSGAIDYVGGTVQMYDYVVSGSPSALTVQSLWTTSTKLHVASALLVTQVSPVKPTGLVLTATGLNGTQVIGTSALDGMITGPHIRGRIDYESGSAEVQFGDYVIAASLTAEQQTEWWYDADNVRTDGKIWKPWPIDPGTVRYNASAFRYLPLDASILGLNPVRLPSDGRVPIFRAGSLAVLGHTGTVGPAVVANGQVINCARVRLSRVRVIGDDGLVINSGYVENLELGLVTITDVTGWSQPVTIEHRVEDLVMVSDAQINGRLAFTRQVTHNYPVPGSYVSSALVVGDMQTFVSHLFDQVTWTNVWSDSQIGLAAAGTYNDILAPIELANNGAVTERWYIQFTNVTTFNVVGEHVGQIASGNTAADLAPINPATGQPYFTLRAIGWGGGWATGNVLRFNTVGSIYPVWVVRTIQQGPESVADDSFTLLVRGDVDRP